MTNKKSFNFNPSSWFNNVFYEKVGENHYYSLTDPSFGEMMSVFNGGYSEANMMMLLQTIPEFFFPVNAVCSRVMNGVYKLVDKDGNEITDNKLWNKMINEGPNWQFTLESFIWHAVMYRMVPGNRYGFAYIPSSLPVKHKNIEALWLLPSHYVDIRMKMPRPSYLVTLKPEDYIQEYRYNGGDTMSNIPPEYVVHDIWMKVGDSSDIITGKGVSPFRTAEYPLSNLIAVYSARNVIYVKRGPLGAIVSAASDRTGTVALTPEEKTEAVNDLLNRHGFGRNQSPFAFTNQPIDYKKFGSTIKELEPFKETYASAAALCGILGVPTSLMPKDSEAKFSNLDIAERNLYENVIIPEADDVCKFLTNLGRFSEVEAKVVVSFDHVTCLQDDSAKQAQAFKNNVDGAQTLYENGHITQNEVRERAGYEAVAGGDVYKEPEAETGAEEPKQPKAIKEPRKLFGSKKINKFLKRTNSLYHGTT